jgi:hypothetical protein
MAARIPEEKLCALLLGEAGETESRALESILQKDPESQAAMQELRSAAGVVRETLGRPGPEAPGLDEEQRRKVLEAAGGGKGRPVAAAVQGIDIDIDVDVPVDASGKAADNSDLFSLDNLQTLARDAPAAAPVRSGSEEETSGLVDLRALAQSREGEDALEISELLNLGPGGSAGLAPVVAPETVERRRNWMIGIGAGLLAVVVIGGLIFVLVREAGKPDPVDENEQAIAMLTAEIERLKESGGDDGEEMQKLEEQLADEQAKKAAREGAEPVAVAKAEGKKSSGGKTKKSGSSGSAKASSSGGISSAAPSKPKGQGVAELDDLLGGGGSKPAKKPAAASSGGGGLPSKLSREQVQAGMKTVAGAVKACGKGAGGTITIRVTISSAGKVTSAKATGPHAGKPVGSCAEKAVKRAKFPKAKNKLDVSYPFKL